MSTSTSALTSEEAPNAAPSAASKAVGAESLAPQSPRIMGRTSYFLAWFGGCVSIGTFAWAPAWWARSTCCKPRWPSPSAAL